METEPKERPGFLKIFKNVKPIIGMIHLKGYSDKDIFERAVREINTMFDCDIDGVMLENYWNKDIFHIKRVLEYISKNFSNRIYGLNVLGSAMASFELARNYNAKFIQLDSVSGHLNLENDKIFHEFIMKKRETCHSPVLGGVRFKYQPHLSGRTLSEDLKIGMERCDAIGVTGIGTGIETDIDKIHAFRKIVGEFPLIVCAGLTTSNCKEQLKIADGGVVGSYFKDNHEDNGDVSKKHIVEFMKVVFNIRKTLIEKERFFI